MNTEGYWYQASVDMFRFYPAGCSHRITVSAYVIRIQRVVNGGAGEWFVTFFNDPSDTGAAGHATYKDISLKEVQSVAFVEWRLSYKGAT